MVQMLVHRIGMDQQGQALVVLIDMPEERLLPIIIGPYEAHAIAMELHGEKFKRPLTHDLFINTLHALECELRQVEVTRLEERTFYALLHISDGRHTVTVDARTSDALALALRAGAPIFVAEEVLEEAQVLVSSLADGDETEKFRELMSQIRISDESEGGPTEEG